MGLTLTRRLGEEIIINDDIVLCVKIIKGNQVSINFTADKKIPIWRKEIWDKYKNREIKNEE